MILLCFLIFLTFFFIHVEYHNDIDNIYNIYLLFIVVLQKIITRV